MRGGAGGGAELLAELPALGGVRNAARAAGDERDELVETLVDLMTNFDMEEPVIGNTLSYWRNIDAGVAEAIEGRI